MNGKIVKTISTLFSAKNEFDYTIDFEYDYVTLYAALDFKDTSQSTTSDRYPVCIPLAKGNNTIIFGTIIKPMNVDVSDSKISITRTDESGNIETMIILSFYKY